MLILDSKALVSEFYKFADWINELDNEDPDITEANLEPPIQTQQAIRVYQEGLEDVRRSLRLSTPLAIYHDIVHRGKPRGLTQRHYLDEQEYNEIIRLAKIQYQFERNCERYTNTYFDIYSTSIEVMLEAYHIDPRQIDDLLTEIAQIKGEN